MSRTGDFLNGNMPAGDHSYCMFSVRDLINLRFNMDAFTIRRMASSLDRPVVSICLWMAAVFLASAGAAHSKLLAVEKEQSSGVAPVRIGAIHVSGQKNYNAEQVIAATGLKAGQEFNVKDLDEAAQRLGRSGAFPEVSYSYVPQGGLITIEFKVEEATKFRNCAFDNFVWLTEEEIRAGLKKEVPLYIGVAPETGEMLDDISRALEKLSKEKGVAVRVSRRIQQNSIADPNWVHMFVAEGANAKVHSLGFTGDLTVNSEALQREAAGLVGADYSAFQSRLFGTAKLLPYYRERGYLQAKVETLAPKILSHMEGSSDYSVEDVYAISEGSVYRWEAAEWSGDRALAPEKLEAATGMKPNDIANGIKIDEGWNAVQKEYSKSGYIEARVSPEPVFDEQIRRVHFRVSVAEGPQYHMGNLAITGLSPKIGESLTKRWRLKPSDVYDATYPMDFVKKEVFPAVQAAGLRDAKVAVQTVPIREKHVMNVTVKVG
jgi:outer membrane protein assembly factor BamA